MKNPTSQQVQTIIDNLTKVLPHATLENHLDMMQGRVTNSFCGSVHCHGGWYAFAVCNLDHSTNFSNGADKMAEHLGFSDMEDLVSWVELNENIWGNPLGSGIFSSKISFHHPSKRPKGAQNLQHIIDHWTEVKERLVAIENQSN